MSPRKLHSLVHQRLFRVIRLGDAERVRDVLTGTRFDQLQTPPADPNEPDRKGRPPLIVAVRTRWVESAVVETLLEFGADPTVTDPEGLTALEYAQRRLEKLGDRPDRVRRSPSLDEHGNLKLTDYERDMLARIRAQSPNSADEFEDIFLQERRKVALRQWMPRRELKIIMGRLTEARSKG